MSWDLEGARKDRQSMAADWTRVDQQLIEGVRVREIANVPKQDGYLTEVYRADWRLDELPVRQVFQVTLNPGAVSGWHTHGTTHDRLFVNSGLIRIVLYDAREHSSTKGVTNEFRFGTVRAALVVVPPRIWHGIENVGPGVSSVLNLVDTEYAYDDPDHWRLPLDTDQIPFRFRT
jgi:dTDP-4-dehydrorhamnose 3,5-epimerase